MSNIKERWEDFWIMYGDDVGGYLMIFDIFFGLGGIMIIGMYYNFFLIYVIFHLVTFFVILIISSILIAKYGTHNPYSPY